MAQWLGLSAFTAGVHVQSLVGELRSHKPRSVTKRKKKGHPRAQFLELKDVSLQTGEENQ